MEKELSEEKAKEGTVCSVRGGGVGEMEREDWGRYVSCRKKLLWSVSGMKYKLLMCKPSVLFFRTIYVISS